MIRTTYKEGSDLEAEAYCKVLKELFRSSCTAEFNGCLEASAAHAKIFIAGVKLLQDNNLEEAWLQNAIDFCPKVEGCVLPNNIIAQAAQQKLDDMVSSGYERVSNSPATIYVDKPFLYAKS